MLIFFYVLLYASTKRNTKLLIVTPYKYRRKNSLKYINKLNPTTYKNNISWPSGVHTKNARLVYHLKFSVTYLTEEKTKHLMIISIDAEKGMWKISTLIPYVKKFSGTSNKRAVS